ncbi:hypothetical protein tb265_09940 [Gemmatimonadetes bacterium T265]|nr:hypothetical protein tb265_09940 [Gemmatimonadetes bacterium T265]
MATAVASALVPAAPAVGDTPDDASDTVYVGGYAVPRYMTLEQFEDFPFAGDERVELVLREVRVSPLAGGSHGWIVRNVFLALYAHVAAGKLGEVFGDGAGYVLPNLPHTLRGPDVSFVRAGRLPPLIPLEGGLRLAPDLVVEVLSPRDTYVAVDEKREQMFEAGAGCWWLVDPRRLRVEVHVPGELRRVLREGETLGGAPVLPDFAMPIADVFADVFAGVERPARPPRNA